jgi:hypothetical protein
MKTQPTPPSSSTTAPQPESNVNFVAVAFFRPKGWFTTLVAVLQWLLGYSFKAPTHVGIYYNGNLYEMTAAGTECREVSFVAVQELALHTSYFFCSDDEMEAIEEEVGQALLEDWYMSLPVCIWYCVRVLIFNFSKPVRLFAPAPYASVHRIPCSKAIYYTPPSSCTCFAWNNLDTVVRSWDIFTPASLYKALTGEKHQS